MIFTMLWLMNGRYYLFIDTFRLFNVFWWFSGGCPNTKIFRQRCRKFETVFFVSAGWPPRPCRCRGHCSSGAAPRSSTLPPARHRQCRPRPQAACFQVWKCFRVRNSGFFCHFKLGSQRSLETDTAIACIQKQPDQERNFSGWKYLKDLKGWKSEECPDFIASMQEQRLCGQEMHLVNVSTSKVKVILEVTFEFKLMILNFS